MLVSFPLGGLDRKAAYRQQKPYTTADCLNVWPVGSIEQRDRGGSRPGLVYAFDPIEGLSDSIRMMNSMILALGDGYFVETDTFGGDTLSSYWQAATGTGAPSVPDIIPGSGAANDNWGAGINDVASKTHVASIRDMSGTFMTEDYVDGVGYGLAQSAWIDMYIEPIDGEWATTYTLIHGVYPGDMDLAGWSAQLRFTPSDRTIKYVDSVSDVETIRGVGVFPSHDSSIGGWLRTYISCDASAGPLYDRHLTAFWQGKECVWDDQYSRYDESTGTMYYNTEPGYYDMGFGYGIEIDTEENPDTEQAGIRAFRIQSFKTSNPALAASGIVGGDGVDGATANTLGNVTRSMFVMSAGGDLYREVTHGRLEILTTDLTLRDDVAIGSVQSGQKLYIADYGDLRVEGTDGTISGTDLDSASYSDWTVFEISTDDDVIVISSVGGDTVAGTYKIDSIAAGAITLTSSPGDGTCSFRIERAPKVYDPSDGTLTILSATSGQVPTGCPLITRHLGRIFLAGAEIAPHVWYCCRQNDEEDWDYSQDDDQRAVAGTASNVGVPGKPLTALISHSDDYLIFGCRNEIWRLRGDPAVAQGLDSLSDTIGIVSQDAWCITPDGEIVFLSADGIYALAAGGESRPVRISRELMPKELLNVDPKQYEVTIEYDVLNHGIHVFLAPKGNLTQYHWWLDWITKTFWPLAYDSDHEPTALRYLESTESEYSGVVLGCSDGQLRRHDWEAENDTGTTFSSYIDIGPIPLARDGEVGVIAAMDATLATDSGDVTWGVYPALTFEATADASVFATATWTAGLNATVRPGGRGQAFRMRVTGTAGSRWAMEHIIVTAKELGPKRVA